MVAVSPQINLFERPWITPAYLLRSVDMGESAAGGGEPAAGSPLDGGRVFRGEFAKARGGIKGAKAAAGIGQIVAYGLIAGGNGDDGGRDDGGDVAADRWGVFVLIGARMEDQGLLLQADVDAVRMRDVMLLEFSTLSASDTLEDALQRSIHTLAGCVSGGAGGESGGGGFAAGDRGGAADGGERLRAGRDDAVVPDGGGRMTRW